MNSLLLALFLAQANMGLTIPTPGVTPGPTYATEISNDLVIIDAHNHTAGNGVQVPTAGLNINAPLSFNGFGATNFNSCTGTACSSPGVTNPYNGYLLVDGGIQSQSFVSTSNSNPLAGTAGPIFSMAQVGDFDSLLPATVSNRYWYQSSGPNNCTVISRFAQTTDGGSVVDGGSQGLAGTSPYGNGRFISAVEQNQGGASTPSVLWAEVTPPPGTTSWSLNSYMQVGPAGVGSVAYGFIDAACNGSHFVRSLISPTSTMTQYSQSDTPAAGTTYIALFGLNQFGTAGVGDPIIGNVQLKPSVASDAGVFAGDFWRVGADPKFLWYDYLDSTVLQLGGGTIKQSPGTAMVVDTDATQIVLEIHDTNTYNPNSIGVWVDGAPYQTVISSSNIPEYHTILLPTGMKKVEVGMGRNNFNTASFGGYGQVMIRAMYFPAASTTWVESEPVAKNRIIVYSDSTAWGDYSYNEPHASVIGFLRREFPGNVYSEVIGGRNLYYDVANGTSDPNYQNIQTMVDYWAKINPTAIWLAQLRNDWFNTDWTSAQFGTAYGVFMDALHARMPEAKIFLQTMTITTIESATNGNGETIPNFRTAEATACNARPWCTLVDGTSPPFPIPAQILSDHFHPSPEGMQTWANAIITNVDAEAPSTASPLDWTTNVFHSVNADAGFFGNVTINGTCTGSGCGITNPYLGTFIADAGNFGSVTSDAGYYAELIAINGIDGTLTLDGGGISQSAASTPLTITGNAPATGSNGIIVNTGPTTLTAGNIEQFQNNSVVKGSIDFAGKFLSLPGDFFASGANTATLKGAIAATGIGAIIDNTIDVTGTGSISQFSTAGTPEFAITGRGHLIPLSTAPTVGSFASGYGTVSGPTVTGGDASFKVSFTTGTATAITYGTALMVVTLNQAYSSQSLANAHAAYSSAPAAGGADQASLYAVFTAGNQITIYAGSGSSATSFIPISAHFYAISVITIGAGASF